MDKTIQLVVNPNGNVGFTYEHSPAEGQPIAMMMDYVVKKLDDDLSYVAYYHDWIEEMMTDAGTAC